MRSSLILEEGRHCANYSEVISQPLETSKYPVYSVQAMNHLRDSKKQTASFSQVFFLKEASLASSKEYADNASVIA